MMAREYGDPTHELVEARIDAGIGLMYAFRQMTDNELRCFVMVYLGDQQQDQVARALGITQQGVSDTMRRALKKVAIVFHTD
jgi:DNA-directed RNA polymerase specialized sigma24 family protein